MKKILKILSILVGLFLLVWLGMTLWVQQEGPAFYSTFGEAEAAKFALVVFDPDPLYNMDEQVCEGFAKGLAERGEWQVQVASVVRAKELRPEAELYVFCANTYNWAPDNAIQQYILEHKGLNNKKVVALTLGSGSTDRAQRKLEELLEAKGAEVVDSQAFWLMRPNDESRVEEENVAVAVDMARKMSQELSP